MIISTINITVGNLMDPFRNAAKAFIVDDSGKLLIVKRELNNIQQPGMWEIPGGRLEIGEDPLVGMKREVREEVGIDILPINVLNVRHFVRADGQKITLMIFYSKPLSNKIILSKEHIDYEWIELGKAKSKLDGFFHPEVDIFEKYFKNR